jgi:hypothetical protein
VFSRCAHCALAPLCCWCPPPPLPALSFISAFSETLALAVIVARGVPALKDALINEPEDHVKAATVWTLGQIGRHTPDHAKAIAEGGVLQPMVLLHVRDDSSAGTYPVHTPYIPRTLHPYSTLLRRCGCCVVGACPCARGL